MVTPRLPMALRGSEIAGTPLRSEHTPSLSPDAAISVGRTISSLSAAQAIGAQTARSAREEQGPPAVAGAVVLKAWKEMEAAYAKKDSVEQPVKSALLTTYLGPTVQQCAAVCMEYATVEYTVMGPVSATLGTLAATVMSPSRNVQPCSAQKIPDAHLPAKMKSN